MKVAYFDCFSGASGDMILAALIDAGADLNSLKSSLAGLNLSGYDLSTSQVKRGLLRALSVKVTTIASHQPHRQLADILNLLDDSKLNDQVRSLASKIFQRLAEAEAQVHGTDVGKVRFHEVGAVDSIVDIVGACITLNILGIQKVYCSEMATGSGSVSCAHGALPIPAPATARLLLGVPTTVGYPGQELTTPTGAAILTSLAERFGPAPDMRTDAIGYGAGQADFPDRPNILRVMVGQELPAAESGTQSDRVWMVQINLDDLSGQFIGPLYELLLDAGALDFYITPIQMKKNRPGMLLSVLVDDEKLSEIEDILFEHTTTFGLRRFSCQRSKLARRMVEVQTRYGKIHMKVGQRGEQDLTASPEFEDCRAAALKHNVSPREVYAEALACYRQVKAGSNNFNPKQPQP